MRVFLLLVFAVLSACGGGSGSSSTGIAKAGAQAAFSVGDPAVVGTLPAMSDALVVDDHIVVRSRSDAFVTVNGKPVYATTRLSVLDKQGKLLSSNDYGFTLAAGYTGEWLMLPSPEGFLMLPAAASVTLLRFDGQARLLGSAGELYAAGDYAPAENGGAADGNGFWLATTFALLPVTDKTQYLLKLCKFDFNGRQLTPPFTISNSALHPRVAASNGAVLAGWLEGGGAMLAMWPKRAGTPAIRSLATGGAQPYPLALDASGKMGVLWNGKSTTTTAGGVMGVAIDGKGAAVLPSGRTDLTQETLSANWGGNVRVSEIDAHPFSGGVALAGSVVGAFKTGDPIGDVLVLADYAASEAPLSAQASRVLRFTLPGGAALGPTPIFRQLMFADHAVLLAGDEVRLLAFYTTRNP